MAANIVRTTTAPNAAAAGPGVNRRERLELDERYENHHHIHIQHRPRTDGFEGPIESRTFHRPIRPTTLHRDEQIGEGEHLC